MDRQQDNQKKNQNDGKKPKVNIWVALLPAIFMTYICSSFVFISDQFFGMDNRSLAYILGGVATVVLTAIMWVKIKNSKPSKND